MTADHCNAEVPSWMEATKANTTTGAYHWTKIPGSDNHILDNLSNCLMLLSYNGGRYAALAAAKKKCERVKASEVIAAKRAAG